MRSQIELFHAHPELGIAFILIVMAALNKQQMSQHDDIKMLLMCLSAALK